MNDTKYSYELTFTCGHVITLSQIDAFEPQVGDIQFCYECSCDQSVTNVENTSE